MKYLFLALALVAPSAAMAAFEPLVDQQNRVGEPSSSAHHRPLFEVRYVLTKAAPMPSDTPTLDFGDGKAGIGPFPLSAAHAVLLRPRFADPNVSVCSGWSCRDTPLHGGR